MPRQARRMSSSSIYHIMLRGNEKKKIFIDEEDKEKVIEILYDKREAGEYLLYSFCVMDNHLHLIIKESIDPISRTMKRIAVSYASYFNKKYKRIGHVFQDRYRSENIENDRYFLAAIRYVHNNPEKAGICKANEYKWSSYYTYINDADIIIKFPEIREVLNLFSINHEEALELFVEFNNCLDEHKFIDIDEYDEYDVNEDNYKLFQRDYLALRGLKVEDLKKRCNREIRCDFIKELTKKSNLSLRRIAELTGVNRETVRRIIVSGEPSP